MRRWIVALALSTLAFGQSKPSLTVRPEMSTRGGFVGAFAGRLAPVSAFYYVEATGLSMRDTKAKYSRKDLEKLESKGVAITVKDTTDVRVGVAINPN